MKEGDGIFMANFRSDRAREIMTVLADPHAICLENNDNEYPDLMKEFYEGDGNEERNNVPSLVRLVLFIYKNEDVMKDRYWNFIGFIWIYCFAYFFLLSFCIFLFCKIYFLNFENTDNLICFFNIFSLLFIVYYFYVVLLAW